jgi:hypothetical protein
LLTEESPWHRAFPRFGRRSSESEDKGFVLQCQENVIRAEPLGFPNENFRENSSIALLLLSVCQPANVRAQTTGGQAAVSETVVLKWLGNAGW